MKQYFATPWCLNEAVLLATFASDFIKLRYFFGCQFCSCAINLDTLWRHRFR